ncbi:MAG: OB-fold domain-containing protein [Myxococcota bacterium]
MSRAKAQVPAVEGWFRMDPDDPRLLGTQCDSCHTYFFPKETVACRNPNCDGTELKEVPLSRRGRLWSFTNNCYPPPAPFVAADPFEPYTVAAVELEEEKMVILGQVVAGVDVGDLGAGDEMELVLDTLFEDDDNEFMVWKWRPVAA